MLLTLVYVLHQNMPFAIGKQILHEQKATHQELQLLTQ